MRGIRGALAAAAGMVLVAGGAQLFWPEAEATTKATAEAAATATTRATAEATAAAAPEAATDGTTGATATAAARDPLPLLRLENGAGVPLWTLSRAEADAAVARHGFRLLPNRLGYLRTAAFAGGQPIHRLARVDATRWLLTASTSERDALVAPGQFRYEGVVGHAASRPATGLALLSRFSGPAGWRVALEAPYGDADELLAKGFRRDGPLG